MVAGAVAADAVASVAKAKLPSAIAVLVILAGGLLIAVGYYGPGGLSFKAPKFSGPAQKPGGGGGGGSGGAG